MRRTSRFPWGGALFSLFVILLTAGIVTLILQNRPGQAPADAEPTAYITESPSPSPTPSPRPRITQVPTPTPDPTVYPTLRRGDKGEAVIRIQKALIALGYLQGRADGDFGAKTEQALKDYQAVQGLAEDGVAGPRTMIHLFDGVSLPQCAVYRNPGERIYHTGARCDLLKETAVEMKLSDAVRAGLEECLLCH